MSGTGEAAARAPAAGLEWLKLLACFGIIAFHQHAPGERLGYAGLPVFTMVTAAMAARSARGRDWSSYRAGRLRRLLLPWLVWSAFYGLVQCALANLAGQPTLSWFHPSMLLMGTYPHLWYLPFAAALALLVGRFGHRGRTTLWLTAGALAIPTCSLAMRAAPPLPIPQWLFVLPAALLGVALGRVPLGELRQAAPLAPFVAAAAVGTGIAWASGADSLALQYAIAVPLTAAAWCVPLRAGAITRRLGATSFGIYVLHPFANMLLALLAVSTGLPFSEWSLLASTCALALLLTLVLRLTPLRAAL